MRLSTLLAQRQKLKTGSYRGAHAAYEVTKDKKHEALMLALWRLSGQERGRKEQGKQGSRVGEGGIPTLQTDLSVLRQAVMDGTVAL